MKRLAVLTSGGDASGMNGAIRSIVRTARAEGVDIFGIPRGFAGLLENELIPLETSSVAGIVLRGGTLLKTARCPDFFKKIEQQKGATHLRDRNIDGLIVIGGDGSVQGAQALSELGISTVTVPATIDNDMHGTDETIGHDTAVNTVVSAVSRIRDTASAHDRAALVEVMGRFAGNIALDAGLACGAEYILVPEVPFSREKLGDSLLKQMREGRTNSLIVCAEGADDAHELRDWLKDKTGIDIAVSVLGFVQRGGAPSARDGILSAVLGAAAVRALLSGERGALVGMCHSVLRIVPYEEAATEKKIFHGALYELARMLGAAQIEDNIRI